MMNDEIKRRKTISMGLLWLGCSFLIFVVFIVRIFNIQNSKDAAGYKADIDRHYKEDPIKAARGNLYASDGSILATTVIKYNVYVDFKVIKDTAYNRHIAALTDSLSVMFGRPKAEYRRILNQQKKKENQYFSLVKGLDFEQVNRLKKFPIFSSYNKKTNTYKKERNLIIDNDYKRILATNQIGRGTIGIDDERGKSGFEGAFSKYLSGEDGKRLVQKVNASQWKPIDYWEIKKPEDGQDVYTTLDLRIQDIAHSALQKQLVQFNAHHGSVVVMEVSTGKVRAMVNLRRNDKGEFVDDYNYALRDATEPGSTFKVVSLLAAMDDGFIDENTTVNTSPGVWEYAKQRITDSHRGGTYDISDVLAQSSNVGSAKLIVRAYSSDPKVFINHLRRWKMFDKLDIELPGATKPFIVTPESKRWNRAALASLSYGYNSRFNLLQLATFYNGIANKGKMVKPLFIDKIMKDGKETYHAEPQVLVNKMATDKAIKMMTDALTKAVEKGTGRSIFTPNLKMAGKTGTTRIEYWRRDVPMQYQASFAGFYPSDNPLYTCIVMIHKPQGSYYASTVAAPVFKEIAGKTFLKTPLNVDKNMLAERKVDLKRTASTNPKIKIQGQRMPKLVGLMGKNAIPQLENMGYRVEYKGVGKVLEQFPAEGTIIKKDQKIYLKLQ